MLLASASAMLGACFHRFLKQRLESPINGGMKALRMYYILLALETILGLLLCGKNPTKSKRLVFLSVSFILLAGLSAFRCNIGYDYSSIYAPLYEPILENPLGSFTQSPHEWGFVLLEKGVALLSGNYQLLFVVTSILIIGLFMVYYYFYSPNPFISVFLFIALSQYYCSMNFIRQTLAAAILLFAVPCLQKRQFIRYLFLVLLAGAFHASALIMIVFYWINLIRMDKWVLPAYTAAAAIIYSFSGHILPIATRFVYSSYAYEDNIHLITGLPMGYTVCMAAIFTALFFGRALLIDKDKNNYIYVNYAFFSLFFVFMGTKHAALDRFSLYFGLTAPLAIPLLIAELEGAKARWRQQGIGLKALPAKAKQYLAGYYAVLVLVFAGGLAIHHYALTMDGHGVVPYQTVFSGPVYDHYEEPYLEPDDW